MWKFIVGIVRRLKPTVVAALPILLFTTFILLTLPFGGQALGWKWLAINRWSRSWLELWQAVCLLSAV